MSWDTIAYVCLACAALPAVQCLINSFVFLPPRGAEKPLPAVSVLIPARNEAANIAKLIDSLLSSKHDDFELIVGDDDSSDRTAEIVTQLAAGDSRVSLQPIEGKPAGWGGKMYACDQLAKNASHEYLLFLDADVVVTEDALGDMLAFLLQGKELGMISGIPKQITGSWLERLLIPLVYFILLGFLSIMRMRWFKTPAYAAACGQVIFCRRNAYFEIGGHEAIKSSVHDGLDLPRLMRRAGWRTDLCDISKLCSCRMYHNARETWNGLEKNAHRGIASPMLIGFFTVLLLTGQVLPVLLLPFTELFSFYSWLALLVSVVISYAQRTYQVVAFGNCLAGAMLHPLGIVIFLAVQWTSLVRRLLGVKSTWKGRVIEA